MSSEANRSPVTLIDFVKVIVGAAFLIVATQVLLIELNFQAFAKQFSHQSIITSLVYLIQSFELLLPLYFFVVRKYKLRLADFGFIKVPVKKVVYGVLSSFGIVLIFNFIMSYIMIRYDLKIPGFGMQEEHISLFGTSVFDLALAVILVGLIAPIVEELFFRGFILKTLLKYIHPFFATLVAATIFGLIHFEFSSAAILIFLGLILNRLYMKTGSLIPGIAFHVINNLLAFWLEFYR